MTQRILIYQDYIHNHGQLFRALQPFGSVGFCDAQDIITGVLKDGARMLVMPGGADLYYCEKLNGAGNGAIRRYVEDGGHYLGLCAGAYYACASLSWAAGTAQEISGPRELAFYPGPATGPIESMIESLDGSWMGTAEIVLADGARVLSCYEAGPAFPEPESGAQKVLARYAALPGQPPAIVESTIGKGRAILSGPHVERVMPEAGHALLVHRNPHHAREAMVYKTLESGAESQQKLWQTLIQGLIGR